MSTPVGAGTLFAASIVLAAAAARRAPERTAIVPPLFPSSPRPPGPIRWLAAVGRLRFARSLDDLFSIDALAGASQRIDADAIRGVATCVAVGVAVGVAIAWPNIPLATALLLAVVAAARVPRVVVARRTKRRMSETAAAVPDLVELLVATVRAGLTPSVAFRRCAGILGGPLEAEVATAVREMELGVPWREAVDGLAARTGLPSLRRLATALGRSQRLGTPVSRTLRAVAEDLRAEQRALLEERARRAPVKMLFPLVLLILPAFLLITIGPVLLSTVRSLR